MEVLDSPDGPRLPDGRMALCTLSGDVVACFNLNDSLEAVSWRRFAGGCASRWACVSWAGKSTWAAAMASCACTMMAMERRTTKALLRPRAASRLAYDLQADHAGNFYYGTGGSQLGPDEPWHGSSSASPRMVPLDAVASGFRAPNGLTIGRTTPSTWPRTRGSGYLPRKSAA